MNSAEIHDWHLKTTDILMLMCRHLAQAMLKKTAPKWVDEVITKTQSSMEESLSNKKRDDKEEVDNDDVQEAEQDDEEEVDNEDVQEAEDDDEEQTEHEDIIKRLAAAPAAAAAEHEQKQPCIPSSLWAGQEAS